MLNKNRSNPNSVMLSGVVKLVAVCYHFPTSGYHSDSSLVQKHPERFKLLEMQVAVKLWQHSTQHKLVNPTFSCRFTEVCADAMTVSSQRVFKSSQGYAVACTTYQPPCDCNLDIHFMSAVLYWKGLALLPSPREDQWKGGEVTKWKHLGLWPGRMYTAVQFKQASL